MIVVRIVVSGDVGGQQGMGVVCVAVGLGGMPLMAVTASFARYFTR